MYALGVGDTLGVMLSMVIALLLSTAAVSKNENKNKHQQ